MKSRRRVRRAARISSLTKGGLDHAYSTSNLLDEKSSMIWRAWPSLFTPEVSAASGFGCPGCPAHVFKADTGLTLLKYRSQTRSR
jgi:hypothetical protein